MQSLDSGIPGKSPNDVIQRGLFHIAHGGKLVDGDVALFAKLPDTPDIDFRILHKPFSIVNITRLRVDMMITMKKYTIARIRVDVKNNSSYN